VDFSVTQTMLVGVFCSCKLPNSILYIDYENWLAIDLSYCNNKQAYFFGPPCIYATAHNTAIIHKPTTIFKP